MRLSCTLARCADDNFKSHNYFEKQNDKEKIAFYKILEDEKYRKSFRVGTNFIVLITVV